MSILNQLKKIKQSRMARLYQRHPLRREREELRQQYLAAVALACAPEREPGAVEREAFLALGDSLEVAPELVAEQLAERGSVQGEDIRRLFDLIEQRNLRWLYLLDVMWLYVSDEGIGAAEATLLDELAAILELDERRRASLLRLLTALRARDPRALTQEVASLALEPELRPYLYAVVRNAFPFARLVHGRWIDHGDGTVSDARSCLRWTAGPVFEISQYIDRPNVAQVAHAALDGEEDTFLLAYAVRPGSEVRERDPLLTVESASGPRTILAGTVGTVIELTLRPGDRVLPGTVLSWISTGGGQSAMRMAVASDHLASETHLQRIKLVLTRANLAAPPPGMSPWRLPTQYELGKLTEAYTHLQVRVPAGELSADVFAGIQKNKLWCLQAEADGGELTLEQLGVFNQAAGGEVMLLLCCEALDNGAPAA